MNPKILVADDKADFAEAVALVLGEVSDEIQIVASGEAALEAIAEDPPDLIFSDLRMQGMSGLELLRRIGERVPRARTILFTGYATIESAVEAMKGGAFDYLTKPVDHDELLLVARRAWKEIVDQQELCMLRAEVQQARCFRGIWGRDPHMLPVFEMIRRVAPTPASVLIFGESGTGKELVARALHDESERADQPFVAFNAAAVPEGIAESELFGCRKGAYTGADRDRKGLFAEANGGTLLIDELPSMPLSLQGKLLRVIQEREVRPVGGNASVPVDVRIVATTNEDPRRLLEDGQMRKDLYYRLAVVRIAIPPLRERVEDVPLLAHFFLERFAGRGKRELSSNAVRILMTHDWPGNVRELQNVIERAAVMSSEREIGPAEIAFESDAIEWGSEPVEDQGYERAKQQALEAFQRRFVTRLLAECGGNLSAAARRASMTRAALHRIAKRLDLRTKDEDASGPRASRNLNA